MSLNIHVGKWGSSLAIRIPKAVAEQCGISEGSSLSLEVQSGQIVMSVREYDLDELVNRITIENRHPEIDAGFTKGIEEW